MLGGTDRKVTLATKEGTTLTQICERASWVWCAQPRPKQNYVAVGRGLHSSTSVLNLSRFCH